MTAYGQVGSSQPVESVNSMRVVSDVKSLKQDKSKSCFKVVLLLSFCLYRWGIKTSTNSVDSLTRPHNIYPTLSKTLLYRPFVILMYN